MNPPRILSLRTRLGFTQTQLANLLGVHSITVWKWEHDQLRPTAYQIAMLESFEKAEAQDPKIGEAVSGILIGAGVVAALYCIFKAATGKS